jgi:hypothetical protein
MDNDDREATPGEQQERGSRTCKHEPTSAHTGSEPDQTGSSDLPSAADDPSGVLFEAGYEPL